MKICVIGSGYVGTTTAAILANVGHSVVAIDINPERVSTVNAGRAPFYEYGLDALVANAIQNKILIATGDYSLARDAEVFFSCVGTPDNPDGSSNLEYVFAAAESAAKVFKEDVIYVQKSTVPVGTGEKVTDHIKQSFGGNFSYVSNPEFLREGTAIADTLLFDRVVAGGKDASAVQKILDLYRDIDENKLALAKTAELEVEEKTLQAHSGQYIATELSSAELIKVTANAFLALKISFANSIAKLADAAKANVVEVMDGVGADKRIGRAFLNAGRGYGGGCFPKDVSGLISSATTYGVDLNIMTAAQEVNASMPGYIVNKAKEVLGTLEGKKCAVLGLAFKAGTSDARKSPAVAIANILDHDGAIVTAYDPQANKEAEEDLRKNVKVCGSVEAATKNADVVFIATDWPEFKKLDSFNLTGKAIVVDCMNCLGSSSKLNAGLTYIGVGA